MQKVADKAANPDPEAPSSRGRGIFKPVLIGILCVLLVVSALFGIVVLRRRQTNMLVGILGIPALPESVSSVKHKWQGWTDVYQTWILEIEPQDFVKLVAGHNFTQEYSGEMSHDISVTDVGKPFRVIHVFTAQPSSDLYGGTIIVAPDDERRRVMICRHSKVE